MKKPNPLPASRKLLYKTLAPRNLGFGATKKQGKPLFSFARLKLIRFIRRKKRIVAIAIVKKSIGFKKTLSQAHGSII